MTTQDIAAAVHRAEAVLRRRPETGLHDDTSATATWQGGTRMIASHDNGTQVATDMPSEIGGSGDRITPGWLFRAGLASCSATSIVLAAAAAGVELTALEVKARSRSDMRGLLGVADVDGGAVPAGPRDVQLARSRRRDGEFRPSACAPSSKKAAGARRCRTSSSARRRSTCASRSPTDGRALGNAARRPPGRRHLHQRALHRAVVLSVAARRRGRTDARARTPSGW